MTTDAIVAAVERHLAAVRALRSQHLGIRRMTTGYLADASGQQEQPNERTPWSSRSARGSDTGCDAQAAPRSAAIRPHGLLRALSRLLGLSDRPSRRSRRGCGGCAGGLTG